MHRTADRVGDSMVSSSCSPLRPVSEQSPRQRGLGRQPPNKGLTARRILPRELLQHSRCLPCGVVCEVPGGEGPPHRRCRRDLYSEPKRSFGWAAHLAAAPPAVPEAPGRERLPTRRFRGATRTATTSSGQERSKTPASDSAPSPRPAELSRLLARHIPGVDQTPMRTGSLLGGTSALGCVLSMLWRSLDRQAVVGRERYAIHSCRDPDARLFPRARCTSGRWGLGPKGRARGASASCR